MDRTPTKFTKSKEKEILKKPKSIQPHLDKCFLFYNNVYRFIFTDLKDICQSKKGSLIEIVKLTFGFNLLISEQFLFARRRGEIMTLITVRV
jgi:hypothetical protein